MIPIVIDTSVAVKWLNQDNEKFLDKADQILDDVKKGNVELFAPELLKYELGNALLFGKKIAFKDFKNLQQIFYSIPITFIKEDQILANASYLLAQNLEITYYDSTFLALTQQLNAVLVTENIKHQGKSKKIKVTPLKEYLKSNVSIFPPASTPGN